jgi:hypothetical protein
MNLFIMTFEIKKPLEETSRYIKLKAISPPNNVPYLVRIFHIIPLF